MTISETCWIMLRLEFLTDAHGHIGTSSWAGIQPLSYLPDIFRKHEASGLMTAARLFSSQKERGTHKKAPIK